MEAVQMDLAPEPGTGVDLEDSTLVLFRLNGQEFRVPAKPRPVLVLRFLDDVRRGGMEVAAAKVLPALLGEDTWGQLLEQDDLEPEHLDAIFSALEKLMMGGVSTSSFGAGR